MKLKKFPTYGQWLYNAMRSSRKEARLARLAEERDTRLGGGSQSCDGFYYQMMQKEAAAEALFTAWIMYKNFGRK